MSLITNNILISFIEKNISIFEKIGNIDLNTYHIDEKPINKIINFNKALHVFFNDLKYYEFLENMKYLKKNDKTYNVSMLTSIIYCLYKQYNDKTESDKEIFIWKLIEKLSSDVFIKFTDFEYSKLKWKKNDIVENINNNKYDYKVLKYLSDYFVINIFIVDDSQLYFCGGNNFIQFRKNIFISKHDNEFYPIFNEYKKTFSISDKLIQNITSNIDKINIYFSELPLKIYNEPIIKIKKNVKFDDKISDNKSKIEYTDTLNGFDVDTECDTPIDIPIETDKKSTSELVKSSVGDNSKSYFKKHSVKELRDIALGCDIDIYKSCGKKLKTKQELLDEMFE